MSPIIELLIDTFLPILTLFPIEQLWPIELKLFIEKLSPIIAPLSIIELLDNSKSLPIMGFDRLEISFLFLSL